MYEFYSMYDSVGKAGDFKMTFGIFCRYYLGTYTHVPYIYI